MMDTSTNATNSSDEGRPKSQAKKKRVRRTSFTEALREKYCHNLNDIGSEFHIDIFVQGLPKNKGSDAELGHIQNVVLNNSSVTHAGLPSDGLLSLCPNVVDLDVSTNHLDSWEELLSIFSQLPRLRVVNLSRNKVQSNMTLLQQWRGELPRLELLSLNSTGVSWPEVLALTQLFPDLRELHLCQNSYRSLEGLTSDHLQSLQALRLNNNQISSWQEVWRLGMLPQLGSLMLSENPICEFFYSSKCISCDPAPHRSSAAESTGDEDSMTSAMEGTNDGNGNVFEEGSPSNSSGGKNYSSSLCGQEGSDQGGRQSEHPTFDPTEPQDYCLRILEELVESAYRGDHSNDPQAHEDAMSGVESLRYVGEGCAQPESSPRHDSGDRDSSNDSFCTSDSSHPAGRGIDSANSSPRQKNVWLRCPRNSRRRDERAMSESEDGSEAMSSCSPCFSEDRPENWSRSRDDPRCRKALNFNAPVKPPTSTSSADQSEGGWGGGEECWCQGGEVPPFSSLETLCLSDTSLNCWSHLQALAAFPQLRQLRVMNVPLWEGMDEEERRMMYVACLPNIEMLNGSEVTPTEREKAERHFLRFYLDNPEQRPPRYTALEAKHGAVKPLVDIDLSARFQEWANLSFFLSGKPKLYERIHVVKSVGKLRSFVATSMALPRTSFRMFHRPCGVGHDPHERSLLEELRFDSLPMSRYDLLDGDEIHVDIIKK